MPTSRGVPRVTASGCSATSSWRRPTTRRWPSGGTAARSAAPHGSSPSGSHAAWRIRPPARAPDLFAEGLALVGSVETVARQLDGLLTRLPVDWLFAWIYNGLIPHAALLRSLDLFATRVLPLVGA
jgi:hypothetical protein